MGDNKENPLTCVIYGVGLQLLAQPAGVDRRTSGIEYIYSSDSCFHNANYRISGKIRIPVLKKHYLIDNFEYDHEYTSKQLDNLEDSAVANVVLVDFMCRNIGLTIGVPKKPKKVDMNFEDGDLFVDLPRQIGRCFRDELALNKLLGIMNRGVYVFGYAVLFVDDLQLFRQKIEAKTSLHTKYESGIFAVNLGVEIQDIKFQHLRMGLSALQLFVLESSQVPSWLESGHSSKELLEAFCKVRTHIDFVLHSNRLRVIQQQMIMVRARCTALLESLPEQKPKSPAAIEERIEKLTAISEKLSFYRTTHLLAKDFLLYEEIPEKKPVDIRIRVTKEGLEGELEIIDEQLVLLEQTMQTRLMIGNIAVSHDREKQQKRTEKSLNRLTVLFGAVIIFEVLASLLSWLFLPDNPLAWLFWGLMIFSYCMLMSWAYREYRKMSSRDEEIDSNEA